MSPSGRELGQSWGWKCPHEVLLVVPAVHFSQYVSRKSRTEVGPEQSASTSKTLPCLPEEAGKVKLVK